MFVCQMNEYKFYLFSGGLPAMYREYYCAHAEFVDEIDLGIQARDPGDSSICFLAVTKNGVTYRLVLALGYSPTEPVFTPAMLFVPETAVVFVGAGERALAYQLDPPKRVAEEEADIGFLGWHRHQQYIIMEAELKIAVWDLAGNVLWSHFVEPPYEYTIGDDIMCLTVMGKTFSFPLATGPQEPLRWT